MDILSHITTARAEREQELYVAALQRERAGCLQRGQDDRVAAIDQELARLGILSEKSDSRGRSRPRPRRRAA